MKTPDSRTIDLSVRIIAFSGNVRSHDRKFFDEINLVNVLIVGATQGIGLGFVQKLVEDTRIAKIYATYRNPESAEKLFAIANSHPDKLTCLSMDIIDEVQITDCCQKIKDDVKNLHLAINCVGFLHDSTQQPEKA